MGILRRWIAAWFGPLVENETRIRTTVGFATLLVSIVVTATGAISLAPFRVHFEPRNLTLAVTLFVTSFYLLSRPVLGRLFATSALHVPLHFQRPRIDLRIASSEDLQNLAVVAMLGTCNLPQALRHSRSELLQELKQLMRLNDCACLTAVSGRRTVAYSVCMPVTSSFHLAYVESRLSDWDIRAQDVRSPDEGSDYFFCPFIWVSPATADASEILIEALLNHVVLFHRASSDGFRVFGPAVMGVELDDMIELGATVSGQSKSGSRLYEFALSRTNQTKSFVADAYRAMAPSLKIADACDEE
jgi:hypothetical protein